MRHRMDVLTDFCLDCGAGRHNVLDNVRPPECQKAQNVIAISHILSVRRMKAMGILVAASLIVSGCFLFTSQPSAVSVCPPIKSYSVEWQNALALELPSLPPEAQRAIVDYGNLRQILIACGK